MTYAVERPNAASRWVPLLGVTAGLAALTALDGPVLCPFRRCTGGYCPLCGATRSAASLARLDPVGALRLYPALPLLAVAGVLAMWPQWLGSRRSDRLLAVIALAIVAVWMARVVLGDVPAPTGVQWPL